MNQDILIRLEKAAEKMVLQIPASLDSDEFTSLFNENFAKLIVEECMNQVREQYVPVLEDIEMMKDTHWDGYVQCGVDSVVGIREHFFGIEE